MAGWKKKVIEPEYGLEVEHWDCFSVFYDHIHQLSTLTVAGWMNEADKLAGKKPLMKKIWEIESGTNPQLAAGAVQFLTGFARAQEFFAGATDA